MFYLINLCQPLSKYLIALYLFAGTKKLYIKHVVKLFFLSAFVCCTSPVGEHHPEWKKYFDQYHVSGCIEIYDLKKSKFSDYNADRCSQRFIPASTFKIANSLIALESKMIPDTNYIIKWDSVVRSVPSWNHDQSMNEAFHHSAVWYYKDVARRIGADRYLYYLNLIHYGNMSPTGAVDSFWLTGGLRISCDEQIEFLKDLYTYQFPISRRTIDLVKGMMVVDKTSDYTLSGKSGWGIMRADSELIGQTHTHSDSKKNIGWYVGYVEKNEDVFFFATNIESPQLVSDNFDEARIEITLLCLKDAGIIH